MPAVTTVTALAKALGVSQPRVSTMKKKAWFQPKEPPWDVEEMRALWVANVGQAGGKVEESAKGLIRPPASGSAPAVRVSPEDSDLGSDDPCAVARAAVRVAAEAVERASKNGGFGPREMTALRDALAEMGRTEKRYLELGVKRGELVTRQQAVEEMGQLVLMLTGAMERAEASVPTRLLQLVGEKDWADLGVKQRVLAVQKLLRAEFDAVRAAAVKGK